MAVPRWVSLWLMRWLSQWPPTEWVSQMAVPNVRGVVAPSLFVC